MRKRTGKDISKSSSTTCLMMRLLSSIALRNKQIVSMNNSSMMLEHDKDSNNDHHDHQDHHHNIVSDVEDEESSSTSSFVGGAAGEESSSCSGGNQDMMMMTLGKDNQITTDAAADNHNNNNHRVAIPGDIITLELSLVPENGFVPEPLFDTMGQVSFVVGWGNYLPGLHQLVVASQCRVDTVVERVSLDAGWGGRRPDLLFTVPLQNLLNVVENVHDIQPGSWLDIPQATLHNDTGGISNSTVQVYADQVTPDAVVLDANPPLAGTSYSCSFRVLSIGSLPSSLDIVEQQQPPQQNVGNIETDDAYRETSPTRTGSINSMHHAHHHHNVENNSNYAVATFALGCFWGAELAFCRQVGVVGTRVGYTQGMTQNPTYAQVCSGTTKHREAVLVIYNPTLVSYWQLLQVACQRLDQTTTTTTNGNASFIMFHEDEENDAEYHSQYTPGFYHHTEEQYETAGTFLAQRQRQRRSSSISTTSQIELLPATTFYNAEEYHQLYLYKGGQSARKGAKEAIRCYG